MIGKTISYYRVLGQIGEGGMGVVYVAEDTRLGRRVAIKIPHAGKDENHYRARFLKEARAVSKLTHPNIAAVYDLGETDDGQPYIVMELVSGQTLGDILAGPGLSVARSVEVIRAVAEALSEAHKQGIVHRDIKPSNVIINERGEVKVLDFGLAKQLEEEGAGAGPDARTLLSARTRSDVVIGTPLYLSPEQARGAKVDGRSDLFALGALLYECVAGRPAFSGANVIEIGAQVLHVDPPPPSRFNPRVPPELDRLVARSLAKRPEDRFQTAEEFAAEMARVRARLSANDTTRTRRLASAENLVRSSAFITMTEELRRPRFSPLSAIVAFAALTAVAALIYFVTRPSLYKPNPRAVSLYEQGVEAMREGANYKAAGLLRQAVEVDDKFALAHARLAEAWTELDLLDRAKDEMIAANELVPDIGALPREDALYFDAVRLTVRRKYSEAMDKYKELARTGAVLPQKLVDLGRACVKADDTVGAADAFTQAAGRDGSYATAWLGLGIVHARTKNLPGATSAFDRAERLYADAGNHEGEAEVHYQRGRLSLELGDKETARRELGRALDLARSTSNVFQQVQALLQFAYVPDDADEARKVLKQAVDLAQDNGMQSLAARGSIDFGAQYLKRGLADEAEQHLTRGLDFAREYKARRLEALASFYLAGLRYTQGRLDEAANYAGQAVEFYSKNGFRKEAVAATMQLSRIRARAGDYGGALQALEEQIRANEGSPDKRLLGGLHRECGSLLAKQDKFAESLEHYREAINIAKALPDNGLLSYSLLNIANSLWRLGRYEEATAALAQLAALPAVDKDMPTLASLVEADIALSQGRFDEAREKGGQALAGTQAPGGRKEFAADADAVICLAEALGGAARRDKAVCEEATRLAGKTGDPLSVANVQLAVAEALLESRDAEGARAMALAAEEFFARTNRFEPDWRALVIAGKACRQLHDSEAAREYFARAAEQLQKLEQSWGGAAAGYFLRQDVQRLRRELGGDAVAEAR